MVVQPTPKKAWGKFRIPRIFSKIKTSEGEREINPGAGEKSHESSGLPPANTVGKILRPGRVSVLHNLPRRGCNVGKPVLAIWEKWKPALCLNPKG